MLLIRDVEIEGFRSIRKAEASDLEEYVPIVGLNGTGKSNLLRVLTLFFSGSIDDEGTQLYLSRDFTDFLKNKRRRVAVRPTFDLSSGYTIRSLDMREKYANNEGLLQIERAWSYAGGRTTSLEETLSFTDTSGRLVKADPEQSNDLLTFVNSIDFRYLPNHARPADIISREMQALRPTLLKRVRQTREYQSGGLAEAMKGMQRVAQTMFGDLSASVSGAASDVGGIGVDVPEEFADLPIQIGLNAISQAGSQQSTELQGSGTQSFLLLHLLALLDRASRERYFGWRQAHIWAIEEPESFLHAGLRSQFADDLTNFASDPRRQVLCTTHSDEFVRIGEYAWLAELDENGTRFSKYGSREALEASSRLRISMLPHPLMIFPDDPLVILEGKSDVDYLDKAVRHADIRPKWKMVSMEDIDEAYGGGQAVGSYLKANSSILRSRPVTAPVIVVKDWDVRDRDVRDVQDILGTHESSCVLRCPEDLCNPELGRSFKGIERYLPTGIVEHVIRNSSLRPESVEQHYPLWVERDALERAKRDLLAAVDRADEIAHLLGLVKWLDQEVESQMHSLSAEHFSPKIFR